jgi:hypothetical protein
LGILSRLLNGMPLADLAPDTRTVKHATGVSPRTLSTPRGEYAMYFDGSGPSTIALELPAGDYSGEWIDVATGGTTALAAFHHAAGVRTIETPEFRAGIALRLTRRSK